MVSVVYQVTSHGHPIFLPMAQCLSPRRFLQFRNITYSSCSFRDTAIIRSFPHIVRSFSSALHLFKGFSLSPVLPQDMRNRWRSPNSGIFGRWFPLHNRCTFEGERFKIERQWPDVLRGKANVRADHRVIQYTAIDLTAFGNNGECKTSLLFSDSRVSSW